MRIPRRPLHLGTEEPGHEPGLRLAWAGAPEHLRHKTGTSTTTSLLLLNRGEALRSRLLPSPSQELGSVFPKESGSQPRLLLVAPCSTTTSKSRGTVRPKHASHKTGAAHGLPCLGGRHLCL